VRTAALGGRCSIGAVAPSELHCARVWRKEERTDELAALSKIVHLDVPLGVEGDNCSAMRMQECRQALARARDCSLAKAWTIWSQSFVPPLPVTVDDRSSRPLAPTTSVVMMRSGYRDLTGQSERRNQLQAVATPKTARVVPARRSTTREQAHVLVGGGDQLRAVDRLQ
jgi:hypothetical protein